MKRLQLLLLFFFSLISSSFLFSQKEEIKIMSYNLTQFGTNYGGCTQTNNSYIDKAINLKTIIDDQKPDILACCEIADNSTYPIYILSHCLNETGKNNWKKAPYTNHGSSIVNMLFYDSEKFDYDSLISISPFSDASHRDINIHRLKHKNSNTKFYVIIVHLSSGGGNTDRATETNAIMSWLSTYYDKNNNYLIMGDFNISSAYESAFQNLINYSDNSIVFNDPLDAIADWGSSNYAYLHTQSTHSDDNGCFVTGGLDDRYDLLLISNSVLFGNNNMKYVNNSYKTLGQDGNHYNSSLTSPNNYSMPTNIINALYNLSDHLPIYAKFEFSISDIDSHNCDNSFLVNIKNPINNILNFSVKTIMPQNINVSLFSIDGREIKSTEILAENNANYQINVNDLKSGCYIIHFYSKNLHESQKLIINQ